MTERPVALSVVPCARGRSFAWYQAAGRESVAEIKTPDATAAIEARSRIHQPGRTFEILTLGQSDLRDGAPCRLLIARPGQDVIEAIDARVTLARWSETDTRIALRFIITRLLARDADSSAPSLERYLALIASWQMRGRTLASFAEGHLVEVDADLPGTELAAFGTFGTRVTAVTLRILSASEGRSTLWVDGALPQHLYVDLGDDLVGLDPQPVGRIAQGNLQAFAALTRTERAHLLDALDRPAGDISPGLIRFSAALCKRHASMVFDEARIDVRGIVRLPDDDLLVVIDLHGDVQHFGAAGVRAFCGAAPAELAPARWDLTASPLAARHHRLCLRGVALPGGAACHRVFFDYDHDRHEVWIREMPAADPQALALAAELWPHATDESLVADAIRPIAAAQVIPTYTQPLRRALFGPRRGSADTLVQVVADGDLEAVHRTLIGLSLTSGKEQLLVRIAMLRPNLWDELASRLGGWAAEYGLAVQVAAYAPGLPEAALLAPATAMGMLRIICRAGAVPRRSEWLDELRSHLRESGAVLVLGAGCSEPDRSRNGSVEFADLIENLATGPDDVMRRAVTMAALPPSALHDGLDLPTVHTLEGALLAQALGRRAAGEEVSLARGAAFVQTASHAPDPLHVHTDRLTLQMIAARPVQSWKRVVRIEPHRSKRPQSRHP